MALRICKAVIKDHNIISSARTVDQLIEFVKPLLVDDEHGAREEPFEFEEGQESVSCLVHMIAHKSNADIYYDLILRLKKVFAQGGHQRQKYTYPALCFSLIRLTAFLNNPPYHEQQPEEEKVEEGQEAEPAPKVQASQARIFKNLAEMINALQSHYPELALRLNLQAT